MADEQENVVANGQLVTLAYVLRLDDGEVFEKTEDHAPLEFIQGQGQVIPGLENALYGMRVGEEKAVVVNPADGYGEYDENDLHVVLRKSLPKELELSVGEGLRFRDKNTSEVYDAYVAELNDEKVLMDFNHPLAGETLYFLLRVIDLRKGATEKDA